ncbi:O-Antigen ligase [Aquisphaera giovannonii]|uniref:O-Antigen ligase n=1 Tax=Aquisphaera giovannonii TaxID=406548 RepID=A0A5B9VXF6_9BACT|nr:O-antigen ligase family protein [Aquisphaera giovannonii]QEH32799.1 O-Antigen ligase [Aquisphaera giovannonii]
MPRRGPNPSGSRPPRPEPATRRPGEAGRPLARDPAPDEATSAEAVGERLRRVALGLLVALVSCRAYWPSEPNLTQGAGAGLAWVLALLVAAGLAVAAALIGGRFRFRWSWGDAAVIALAALVGLSASRGLDRRPAINLAWEWGGVAIAYLLARNLPRTRAESKAILGVLVASAVAVSAYGLYQAAVEMPSLKRDYLRDGARMLREAGVAADEPRQVKAFEDRLLGSNEVFSTFGLANSLAGYLIGPTTLALAMALAGLLDRKAAGSRWPAFGLAAIPLLSLLICLELTKSRSAWLGTAAALAALAWGLRGRVPRRLVWGAGLAGVLALAGLLGLGLATGRLDVQVLTQSTLSMRYRTQYWRGTWGVITEGAGSVGQALAAPTFWAGVGPGNFGHSYLLHKLPWSSEEIQDPHDLFLEAWATAGVWAFAFLVAALGFGLWNTLRPVRDDELVSRETPGVPRDEGDGRAGPPASAAWLAWCGASGLLAVFLVGHFNLFQNDLLTRWLVLAATWGLAAWSGSALWRRAPLPGLACGAAVLGMAINLLAAGGIGFASVSLEMWTILALGLNLREDRGCGRLRVADTRIPGLAFAVGWSALAGIFAGAILPFWRSEAAVAAADDALARQPPQLERAEAAYESARLADMYSPRPWLGDAYLQLLIWQSRGAKPADQRWRKVPALLLKAASPPRNPANWSLHYERARATRDLLGLVGSSLTPRELITLQGSVVEALRTASRLYPTNPLLHAELARSSAAIQMFQDAAAEAKEALRLDGLLASQPGKQLAAAFREELKSRLPEWEKKADQFPIGQQTPPAS